MDQNKKKVKFIDCRDPNEYAIGHIDQAVNVNEIFSYLGKSDKNGQQLLQNYFEDVFQRVGVDNDHHIITYEDRLDNRFGSSSRGYFLLKTLGHQQVQVLDGGYQGWLQAGGKVNQSHVQCSKGNFQAQWDNTLWSSQRDVEQAIRDGSTILLDVRDKVEWTGESSSPYGIDFVARKGRLPGAIHLPWTNFFTQNDQGLVVMKSPQEVIHMCSQLGFNQSHSVIVYCFKGARASNSLIALREAGFNNVTNYFASWNEWAMNFDLNIDDKKKDQ